MIAQRRGAALLPALFAALTLLCAAAVEAASLTSVRVTEGDRLTRVRPDFPVPNDPGQQFYIQRSVNPNTVIYAARFASDGRLDADRPINVYWRRFNDAGEARALNLVERQFAYGVNIRRRSAPNEWRVQLKALPQIAFVARQTAPFEVALFGTIGGKLARPVYGYAVIDESGLIPRVTELSLHGYVVATGRAISEYFRVSGGEIRP